MPRLIVCAAAGDARGLEAAAAAVAVAATPLTAEWPGTLVLDLRAEARPPRGALLAAGHARSLEAASRQLGGLRAAARGRLCFATAAEPGDGAAGLASLLGHGIEPGLLLALCDPVDFRACLDEARERRPAALVKAAPRSRRALLALLSRELGEERVRLKVWVPPIGLIPGRRALAGLEPGGESGRRAGRFAAQLLGPRARARPRQPIVRLAAEEAQALPAVLAIALLTIAVALILACDRRRGDRQGEAAAVGRPRGALGGAVDARRLPPALRAGKPSRRNAEP